MKLIDLLVKELPKRGGWPDGVAAMAQDANGAVQNYIDTEDIRIDSQHAFGTSRIIGSYSIAEDEVSAATDRLTSIITRVQYEAALAKNDGWIEWGGGECPVEEGTLVDVRFRDGDDGINIESKNLHWFHKNWSADIMAYRLHKPYINSRANDGRLEQDLNECIGQDVDMPEWNGDGVPPIGCACEMQDSKGTWLPVDIIAKNDGFTFGWSYDYRIVLFGDKADEFRPLRTEAEKAREGAETAMRTCLAGTGAGITPLAAKGIYEAIAAGKIPGVKLEVK